MFSDFLEHLEGLLEVRHLLFPLCLALRVGGAGVEAVGLQLPEICLCSVQLLLRALQVRPNSSELLRLGLLLAGLVLRRSDFGGFVNLGVFHKFLVLLEPRLLGGLRLCLQLCEVALDHLQHGDYTAALATHAGVRLVAEDFRLGPRLAVPRLQQGAGAGGFLVEVSEYEQCLGHGRLCLLGILHCGSILGTLLLPHLRGFRHVSI
mmetsp:Transcript_49280/g.102464  ORF Transcript_49280/g.102464 Transcript_49280/m.102464 type:complete len:206 (-) Transcript_49280:368-985(-)